MDSLNCIRGIQMIGTQRSGSNLLRVMLDRIGEITAPHPPHILQRFLPLLPLYGDLADKASFRRLTEDVCELVRRNPVPWEGVTLDTEAVSAACREPTLYELFRVVYDTAARQKHTSCWLCKSMKNVFYAEGIEATGLSPYYIYLYRDGRDVALSFQKAIVGEKHVYALAEGWRKDQQAALRLKAKTPPARFFSLSYEALLADPEAVMRRLCGWLGAGYSDRMMEYYKSEESLHTAIAGQMWQNVARPILKNNTRKFLRELSTEEIAIFESVAGDTLQKLGYDLYTPPGLRRSSFSEEEVAGFNRENKRLKQAFRQQAAPEDLAKRRPQDELLERIKQYGSFKKVGI